MRKSLGRKMIAFLLTLAAMQSFAESGKKKYLGGGEIGSATEGGMSQAEFASYMKDCKKVLLDANPKRDAKDADMLCRDPYLKGKPNESKSDRARRERLIKETDKDKEAVLDKFVENPKGSKKASDFQDPTYLKNCRKELLKSDPGEDSKDIEMLCSNPYLKAKPNESYEDQVRRKRLIEESEKNKEKALDKYVVPPSKQQSTAQ